MIVDINSSAERFYHSFPRKHPTESEQEQNARGLRILRLIKSAGLVLAPEVITWNIPLQNGDLKTFRHRQIRACFTQLSETQVAAHAEVFGHYSLSFPVAMLRRFGAIPVIYIPQAVPDEPMFSGVGPVIAWMFEMARYTFDQLNTLSDMADPVETLRITQRTNPEATHVTPDYTVNLQNTRTDGSIAQEFTIRGSDLKGVIDYLNYQTAPFKLLRGARAAAQALFYPTDDLRTNELLSYYRQKEWRVIPGMEANGISQVRATSPAEKQMLLDIDNRFWSRRLEDDRGSFSRLEESFIISEFDGKPLIDSIDRILVPKASLEEARELFGQKVYAND